MSIFKLAFVWCIMSFILIAAGVRAQNAKSLQISPAELWNMDKPRQAYTLGEKIELSLGNNEMVQLDCDTTPHHGKFSCLVVRTDKLIGNDFYDADGEFLKRGHSAEKLKGSLRQVGDLPYLAIMTWTPEGERYKIQFCIESDIDKIRRLYQQVLNENEQAKSESGRWSCQIQSLLPIPKLSETERLAGFIKLWSEVKYNFAFFSKHPELDWDKVLVEYLPKVQKAESVFEYYRILRQCMALLHDGHTDVYGPNDDPFYQPPIEVAPIAGRAIIVAVAPAEEVKNPLRKEQMLKADLKLGEEVTEVDGRLVQEILRHDYYPYICASTTQALELKAFPEFLNGEDKSQVVLTIKDLADATRKVTLTRARYLLKPSGDGDFQIKDLESGILYINLPDFESKAIVKQFEAELPRIRNARGLLLDVRHNGGGSSNFGYAIIGYFIDKPFCGSHWKTREYIPAFRAWGRPDKWYEEDSTVTPRGDNPFLGPIVVLTGPETVSAAEDFVVALHGSGRAKVIGEKTNGSTGQPLMIKLPGGGGARICTKWDTYADGREFVGVGVIPGEEVHPTREDISSGKDRVLEAGILSLKKAMESRTAAKETSANYFLFERPVIPASRRRNASGPAAEE